MRTSLYHQTKVVNALAPTTIATDTDTNGASVDLWQTLTGDWRSVLFVARAGTVTDGSYVLTVEDSPDNTNWTDVTATDMVQGPSGLLDATGELAEIAYTGNKRYCRLVVTSTDTTTGGSISATAILHGSAGTQR